MGVGKQPSLMNRRGNHHGVKVDQGKYVLPTNKPSLLSPFSFVCLSICLSVCSYVIKKLLSFLPLYADGTLNARP